MDTWLSYSLSDFLLFSAETYWRLFERANGEQWPMPLAGLAAGLILLAAALWPRPAPVRLAALLVGGAMLWVSQWFLRALFLPINPAMEAGALIYALGGALLIVFALLGRQADEGRRALLPTVLIMTATLGYPILAPLQGRNLPDAEFIGVAPDPTAVAAAGLALLAARGWTRLILLAVPVAWLGWSALTLYALEASVWPVPLAAVLIALAGLTPLGSSPAGPSRPR